MREFELIGRLLSENARLPAGVTLPPGDDMAAIALPGGLELLAAADSAIEGRHAPMGCDPFLIGRKAVLRNLSDVAAMGNARPVATLACVAMPTGIDPARAWRLIAGVRETAEKWNAPLVGGDTATMNSREGPIVASVTILAMRRDPTAPIATRASARVGDGVFVTGTIGGAWDRATGLGRHLDFTPRLALAHALCDVLGDRLGAMIDVSDGLGRDLGHIATASGVAVEVELARVPVTPGIAPREAIGHGEDYELAFTARGAVPGEIAGVPVARIGTVVAGGPSVTIRDGSGSFDAMLMGFSHDGESGGGTR